METQLGNSNGKYNIGTTPTESQESKTRVIKNPCPHCKGEQKVGCHNRMINVGVEAGREHKGWGSYSVCRQFKEYDNDHPSFVEPPSEPCPYGQGCTVCGGKGRVFVSRLDPPRQVRLHI